MADAPLPWRSANGKIGASTPATNARQWLESADIDASRLANLSMGRPLDAGDEETIVSVLYRLPRLPASTLDSWKTEVASWADVAQRVQQHQAEVFRVSGRATHVERVNLLPEAAERFEFDHYFRVSLALEREGWPAVVCVHSVPRAWPDSGSLDERAAAYGLLLKTGDRNGDRQPLVFAAARMMWFPDRANEALEVDTAQVYLAERGMDLARFDDLQDSDRKPLVAEDRECFYELLAAMKHAAHAPLRRHAEKTLDLATLLNRPAAARGRLMEVRGTARRVQRIEVTDPNLSQRLGIDHYYQIDVFIPLGDQIVRLGEGKPEKNRPPSSTTFR